MPRTDEELAAVRFDASDAQLDLGAINAAFDAMDRIRLRRHIEALPDQAADDWAGRWHFRPLESA